MTDLTEESRCELCWKTVRSPCVTACGPMRDASECQELVELPRDERGFPIRTVTRVERDADMNLHQVEEPVSPFLLGLFAPGFLRRNT